MIGGGDNYKKLCALLSYLGVFTFRTCILICLVCIVANFKLTCWLSVFIVVVVLCVLLSSYVYLLYYVRIAVFLL